MNIDYTKLGYRWKGLYSSSSQYNNKDVVFKEGAAFYYDSTDQTFKIFARGQIEAISKGELIVGGDNTIAAGFDGEQLFVKNGAVEFVHPIDRNGTRCIALGGAASNWMGNNTRPSIGQMIYIMADGSVRATGRAVHGALGQGNVDEGRGYITPVRINFPYGTPAIVKARISERASHFIDRDGVLWGCGMVGAVGAQETSNVPVPINVSENSDIGSNKIVEVYQFTDGRYSYYTYFALDENGKVYSWGYNSNNVLGYTGGINPKATLLEFTQDTPIKNIMSDAVTVSGMITTEGDLYTVGAASYNWVGHNTDKFTKIDYLQGPVAEFHAGSGIGHWNSGHYIITTIVLEDGRMYFRANGWGQVGWGTPSASTTNSASSDVDLLATNVAKSFVKHGGYAQGIVQTKSGYWLYRGTNRHAMSPTSADINPTSAADWDQTAYRLNQTYFNSSVTKAIFTGENLRWTGMLLNSDGKCFSIGANAAGHRGLGHTYESAIGVSPDVDFNHHSNDYVLLNKTITDISCGGWQRHTTGAYQDNIAFFYLTNEGDVYVSGSSYYGLNNRHPGADYYTPNKIYF